MNLPLFIRLLLLSTLLGLAACGGGGSASDSHPDSDLDSEIGHTDSDQDGIDDDRDMDDDDDGVNDSDDAFPLDSSETMDTDADGTGDNADTDDDGDGVQDTDDACPLDATETLDSDGDGICDNADLTPNGVVDQTFSGGVVSGFGSIYVNGIKYSTDTAKFVNDDQETLLDGEKQFEVGDYVWVEGTLNGDGVKGVASTVIYDVDLIGQVSEIDPETSTFKILGRTVKVSQDTVFDDDFVVAQLSGLSLGVTVEVSGYDQVDGSLLATRIDLETSNVNAELKVEGIITQVDLVNQTFNIATQVVDFSNTLIGFSPVSNQWVEVYGSLNAENILIATKSQIEDSEAHYGLSTGDDSIQLSSSTVISIEGVVTELSAGTGFAVNGYPVLTSSSTLYIGGDITDINLDTKLLVQGVKSDDLNALMAERVYVRVDANLQIEGIVTAIDFVAGTMEVAGIKVTLQSTTQMEDGTGVTRQFRLEQLSIGDFVEVSGHYNGDLMVAYRVERDDDDDDLDEYAGHSLTIDGVLYYVDDNGFMQDESGNYHVDADGSYSSYSDTDDYQQQTDYQGSVIEIEGIASAISSNSLTLYGNVINFTNTTVFEVNDLVVNIETFISSAVVSPYVEINAIKLSSSVFEALTVELEPQQETHEGTDANDVPDYSFELKGIITSIDTSSVQLSNGYSLQFSNSTIYETYSPISQASFLSTIATLINPVVEVKAWRNASGILFVAKIELESSEIADDDDTYSESEIEFEGYGSIDNQGITIQGVYIAFISSTYFELFDRQVQISEFLANVSNTDKFEVKARTNASGAYEAIKVELDD